MTLWLDLPYQCVPLPSPGGKTPQRHRVAQRVEFLAQDGHGARRAAFALVMLELGNGVEFLFFRSAPVRGNMSRRRRGDDTFRMLRLDRNPVDQLSARRLRGLDDPQPRLPAREVFGDLGAECFMVDARTRRRVGVRRDVFLGLVVIERAVPV